MRISLVSQHLPELEGRANDRALYALGQGLSAEGHTVAVWSWRPEPPTAELPPWCRWEPLPPEARWRTRARALVQPRSDVVVAHWEPEGPVDAVVADGPLSLPAIAGLDRTAMAICFLVALVVRSARRRT